MLLVVMSAVRFISSAFSVPVASIALLSAFIIVTVPLVIALPVVLSCTFTFIVVFPSVLLVICAVVLDGLCCMSRFSVVVVLLYSSVGAVSIVRVFSPTGNSGFMVMLPFLSVVPVIVVPSGSVTVTGVSFIGCWVTGSTTLMFMLVFPIVLLAVCVSIAAALLVTVMSFSVVLLVL